MKKFFLLLCTLVLFLGCISTTTGNEEKNENNASETNGKASARVEKNFSDNILARNKTFSACAKPVFTSYLVNPDFVSKLGQIGTLHGSGQFTVGRSYIHIKDGVGLEKIPIYAPVNMTFTRGAFYSVPAPVGASSLGNPLPDYALYFDAGCGVEIHLGHLKEAVPEIAKQFSAPKPDSRTSELKPVYFKAGDLVGYFIPNSGVAAFDFMVHDESITNEFANNARQQFGQSDNLLHIACPYDFYTGEMKDAYYKLISGVEGGSKECGPASRDYPGTISGLWFSDAEVKKSMYDYSQEGNYGSLLAIVGDADRVLIGSIGSRASTFIYPNDATYKNPKDVTSEHCYQMHSDYSPSELSGFVFFKLVDEKTLKVAYSEKGECPNAFPEQNTATYYR